MNRFPAATVGWGGTQFAGIGMIQINDLVRRGSHR